MHFLMKEYTWVREINTKDYYATFHFTTQSLQLNLTIVLTTLRTNPILPLQDFLDMAHILS